MTGTTRDSRDNRGEWQPRIITSPAIFDWPPRPLAALKWLFGYPGYLLPWIGFLMLIPLVTWFFLTPDLAMMKTFEFDWIATVFFRNVGLLVLVAGGFQFSVLYPKGPGNPVQVQRKLARETPALSVRPSNPRQHLLEHPQRLHCLDRL